MRGTLAAQDSGTRLKLLPELEAYRDRLVERCSAWAETPPADLLRDLTRCRDQAALLEKGIAELGARLGPASGAAAAKILHRLAVQEQMRDLTTAYAEVLKRHLDRLAP